MIDVKEFETWSDFEAYIKNRHRFNPESDPRVGMIGPSYIFRGQSDAVWNLDTSLERTLGHNIAIGDYYDLIARIRPAIESFTNQSWSLPPSDEFYAWLGNSNSSGFGIPGLEYMAYLRHHGFPSPLMDWSYSPFVASYFAFRDITTNSRSVAIFEYYTEFGFPPQFFERPRIFRLERGIRTHRRHYLQQSVYTICCKRDEKTVYYANHQGLYSQEYPEGQFGETVKKYILPTSEREKALWSLESYNINAYSLLGTEESLLETFFLREFVVEKLRDKTYPNWNWRDP